MMFLDHAGQTLAISQPAHAWVAGQLLRAWPGGLDPALLLAAEQHDLAWLDWETRPVFEPATRRPKLFRDVGAADHAPIWTVAVERARTAWGTRVALLVSRHGGVIYTRFTDRHRVGAADAEAASAYLARQAPLEAAWAAQLGLSAGELAHDSDLIALADTLSLGLCGGVALPLDIPGPGTPTTYHMARSGAGCTLSPWPFTGRVVTVDVEARHLPAEGFGTGAEMQRWVATAAVPLRLTLAAEQ